MGMGRKVTLEDALARYPGAETFAFGGGPELSAEILALVRGRKKTVTCDALDAFAERGDALPQVGRTDIVLGLDGQPACAIRTIEVQQMPFDAFPEALVADHGEFATLAEWRAAYQVELSGAGHFHPQVMLVVERFELVEDFGEEAHV